MILSRNLMVAVLSTIAQYYDYHLFGILAAQLYKYFMPFKDTLAGLCSTYIIMYVATIAKPVGALILGRVGDIYGRSSAITISIIAMGIGSALISIIPSYETIGVFSIILLLIARMTVASMVGAGGDGIRIYVYENISKNFQCLGSGITSAFSLSGSLIASLSAYIFTLDIMPWYGWKLAFAIGSILSILVLVMRCTLQTEEQNHYRGTPDYGVYKNLSTWAIVRQNWQLVCLNALLSGILGFGYQFIIIFWSTYNFEVIKFVPQDTMQIYRSLCIGVYILFALLGGYIADRVGRYKTAIIAGILLILLYFMILLSIYWQNQQASLILYVMIGVVMPCVFIPGVVIMSQSVKSVIRYRIISISHSIGSIILSAGTSTIATLIYKYTGLAWAPLIYPMLMMMLLIIVIHIIYTRFIVLAENSG